MFAAIYVEFGRTLRLAAHVVLPGENLQAVRFFRRSASTTARASCRSVMSGILASTAALRISAPSGRPSSSYSRGTLITGSISPRSSKSMAFAFRSAAFQASYTEH